MGGHQPETSYRFSLSLLRRADACLWHVPNPPKDGAYAAECPVHYPLRGTPLPVSLLSGNGYRTQSVQMSWNENHQTGLCVDSIAARQGLTIAGVQKITGIHWNTIRQAERKSESTVWQTTPNALLTQADWKVQQQDQGCQNGMHMGTRTTDTFLP